MTPIVFSLLNGLLSLAVVITFVWMLAGLPAGFVLSIIYVNSKDAEKKRRLLKWIKICFSSLLAMLVIFLLYASVGFSALQKLIVVSRY